MTSRALWLASALRDAGLEVVELPGWKSRGDAFRGLRAVVVHHDGSAIGDSPGVPSYMAGQIDQRKAGAQLWVNRYGVWHVIASGAVFHAGRVLPGKPGNPDSLGVETDATTNEPWPGTLLASLRIGTAAILRQIGQAPNPGLEFHKTICSPPGRKNDPWALDLDVERKAVAALLAPVAPRPPITTTTTTFPEDDMQRIDTQIDLDGEGRGYRDLPVDPLNVVNVVFNTQNPKTKGYQPAPDWHRLNINGRARIVVEEGLPGGRVDCSVWVA